MFRRFFASRSFSTGIRERVYKMPVMHALHHDFESYPIESGMGYDIRDYQGVMQSNCSVLNYYVGLGLIHYGHYTYRAAIPYFQQANAIPEAKEKVRLLEKYCYLAATEQKSSYAQELMLKIMVSNAKLGPKTPFDDLSYSNRLLNCGMIHDQDYMISTVAYYAGLAFLEYGEDYLFEAMRAFHEALELANREPATSEQFKRDIQQKLSDIQIFKCCYPVEKRAALSRRLIEPLKADVIYDQRRRPEGLNTVEFAAWQTLSVYQRIKYSMGHEIYLTYQSAYLDGLNYFDKHQYPEAYKCFTRSRDLQNMNPTKNMSVMKTCEAKIAFIIDHISATQGKHVEDIVRGPRYP